MLKMAFAIEICKYILILCCTIIAANAAADNKHDVVPSENVLSVVREMKMDIRDIQQIVTSQGKLIAKLEHENVQLKRLVSKQEDDINELRMKLDLKLEVNGEQKYESIQSFVNNTVELSSDNGENGGQVITEDSKHKSTGSKTKAKKSEGVRAVGSSHVAFSTYLSHPQTHIGAQQIIKFDGVITNDGNAFNPHSGIFTVPVTGTYVFFVILNSSETDVIFKIMVDDVEQASGIGRPSSYGQGRDAHAIALVVLRLNQGVSVWVENYLPETSVFSGPEWRWNTFSGFLLY